MKKEKIMGKTLVAMTIIIFLSCPYIKLFHIDVQASTASKTRKAEALYNTKLEEIYNISDLYQYKMENVCGDSVPELIVVYCENSKRHGEVDIYTFKSGKIKRVLSGNGDNLELISYKKTNSIVLCTSYHDYKCYAYYKYSKGKFTHKASKCYNDVVWDEARKEYGKWWYEKPNGSKISKLSFKNRIKKLTKGKKKNLECSTWETYYGYYW